MPAGVAFTALLMLLESAASAQPAVPPLAPPTNVTVTCDDGAATASWQYEEDADVHFLVYVGDSGRRRHLRDETWRRDYGNLSAWVWESLESVMDVHSVSVAAVAGADRSSANASVTFTYNSVKMADVMCKLDFPHVDVKASDADDVSAAVIFRNPLRHHPQLSRATRRGAVFFQFNVNSGAGDVPASCSQDQNVCRTDVSFPPGSAECVTLTGLVSDSAGGSLALRPSPLVCAERRSPLALLLGVPAALLLLVCVAAAAWKAAAWAAEAGKAGEAAPPKWLLVPWAAPKARVGSCCAADSGAPGLKLRVPLIFPGDDNSSAVCTEMASLPVALEEEAEEAEEAEGEQEPEEDEEDEAAWDSNYDRVHVNVEVQMGNGDEAWGYKER